MSNPTLFFDCGRRVDVFEFTKSDLTVVGIARALARINRFSGNGEAFERVSVAQHSVNLSWLVPPGLEKAALMHDVSEIFVGDIPSPIKNMCPDIQAVEERIQRRVAEVFEIPFHQFLEIHPFDKAIARDEARMLFPDSEDSYMDPDRGLGIEVITMDAPRAADEWARRFYQLYMPDSGIYDA
jgi:hypothetical protein